MSLYAQLRYLRPAQAQQLIGTAQRKWLSSAADAQQRRSDLFTLEQRRQRERVGRVEKIEIRYQGLPSDTTLLMNRGISTPFNCAQHLGERHCQQSAVALLDGQTVWDMHRPITESCTLQLLHFNIDDPHHVNRAFWRTCSFMLGAVLQQCIKDSAGLRLHSFPAAQVRSGSFVHDVALGGESAWEPTKEELRAISAEMVKLASRRERIERLEVQQDLALEMFRDNEFKCEQLPSIARNGGAVTLYRVGQHVDISRGPMVAHTGLVGKCTVAAVHRVAEAEAASGQAALYRVQGVALPAGVVVNHVAFGILEERARKLNPARLPNEPFDEPTAEQMIA